MCESTHSGPCILQRVPYILFEMPHFIYSHGVDEEAITEIPIHFSEKHDKILSHVAKVVVYLQKPFIILNGISTFGIAIK